MGIIEKIFQIYYSSFPTSLASPTFRRVMNAIIAAIVTNAMRLRIPWREILTSPRESSRHPERISQTCEKGTWLGSNFSLHKTADANANSGGDLKCSLEKSSRKRLLISAAWISIILATVRSIKITYSETRLEIKTEPIPTVKSAPKGLKTQDKNSWAQ